MIVNDTMRGLFFIVKGTHAWKKEPSYTNRITGEVGHLGGYDPYSPDTNTWFQVMDRKCFYTIYCGSDYDKAVTSIRRCIVKHKGVAKNYFKEVSKYTSDDYYEVHYLGRPELTPEKRAKKCEGRCPRTSPIMMDMYRNIDDLWGDYYLEHIQEQEELAYQDLEDERPLNKSRKLVHNSNKVLKIPKRETPTEDRPAERKPVLKPKKEDATPKTPFKVKPRPVKLFR